MPYSIAPALSQELYCFIVARKWSFERNVAMKAIEVAIKKTSLKKQRSLADFAAMARRQLSQDEKENIQQRSLADSVPGARQQLNH